MGRIVTALLGLMLTLSACSGDAEPSPPPSSAPPTTTTPTTTPSPTAPVMPEAAKAHTKAGAKAFVEYFWEVVDYAQQTGDTAKIASLSLDGCKGCDGGIQNIDRIYDSGGEIRGGETTPSHLKVDWLKAGDLQLAHVTVDLRFAAQTIDMPGTTQDEVSEGSSSKDRLELIAEDGGWKVSQLVVLG